MVTTELVLRGRVLQLAPELRALETDSSGVRVGLQLRVTSLHHFLLHLRIALDLCVLVDRQHEAVLRGIRTVDLALTVIILLLPILWLGLLDWLGIVLRGLP
jgi:hypothetical protein